LEKILYEKVLNNRTLGRARKITTPKKWINHNPADYKSVQAGWLYDNTISAKVWDKILYPFYKTFWWSWQRDLALQRGYAMDDFYVHTEKDLRRSPFYEHIWRESTHPYEYLMYKYRRMRYYKVERCVQGFFVPEHLRDEVKKRTWAETMHSVNEWENFVFKNYAAEISPTTYDSRGKWNPLELFNQYGLFRNESWERLFYNEEEYDYIEPEDYERYVVKPGGYDVETVEGRMAFENKINTLIQDFPGLVTPEGEQFDFENFYMKWTLLHGRDTSRFDQSKLVEVEASIRTAIDSNNESYSLLTHGAEEKVGTSNVGKDWPERMTEDTRSAFQN